MKARGARIAELCRTKYGDYLERILSTSGRRLALAVQQSSATSKA
jgi:hypothetical protein